MTHFQKVSKSTLLVWGTGGEALRGPTTLKSAISVKYNNYEPEHYMSATPINVENHKFGVLVILTLSVIE